MFAGVFSAESAGTERDSVRGELDVRNSGDGHVAERWMSSRVVRRGTAGDRRRSVAHRREQHPRQQRQYLACYQHSYYAHLPSAPHVMDRNTSFTGALAKVVGPGRVDGLVSGTTRMTTVLSVSFSARGLPTPFQASTVAFSVDSLL